MPSNRLVLYALVMLPAVACGPGRPSESQARAFFEQRLSNRPSHPALLSFRQTDGQEGELFGTKMYVMEFAAEMENVKHTGPLISMDFRNTKSYYCQGDRGEFKGSVTFELKDSGWHPTSLSNVPDVVGQARSEPCPLGD